MKILNLFKIEKIAKVDNIPIGAVASNNEVTLFTKYNSLIDNPHKILDALNKSVKDLKDLLTDSHVYSVVQSRKSAILSLEYELLSDNEERRDFIQSILQNIDLRRLFGDMLDAVLYGYKPIELYWDFIDGKVVLVDAIGKPSWWFGFDNKNRLVYINDRGQNELLPANKFILLQNNPTYTNPYGDSILANCLLPFIYKKGAYQLWAEFVEKYGSPFLVGKAQSNINPEQLSKLNDLLTEAKRTFTMATSSTFDIQALEVDRNSATDTYNSFINFLNSEISKAVLSQTLTTEQSKTGSYAMSKTHFDIRKDIVDSDKAMIEQSINKIIKLIVDYNYNDGIYPKFRLYEEEDIDMELAKRDEILSKIIDFTPDYIKTNYGLKDSEFKMKAAAPTFADNHFNAPSNPLNDFADTIIEFAVNQFKKGTNYDEILKGVYDMFPGLPIDEVENYLGNAIYVAKAASFIEGK